MDSTLWAGIITSVSTVVGALLGRSGIFDGLLSGVRSHKLQKEWTSVWIDIGDVAREEHKERFFITKQRGARVEGYIVIDHTPDKRWDFEGRITLDNCLQLYYYPSKKAEAKMMKDYGCYFFEWKENKRQFVGYSVGFDYLEEKTDISEHRLIPVT